MCWFKLYSGACTWTSLTSQLYIYIYPMVTGFVPARTMPIRTFPAVLTHWSRVTHICVSKLTTIGADIGSSPGRRQAIIWTNAGKCLFQHMETNFSEILVEIYIFSFKKMYLKMLSGKWRPFCLGNNVLDSNDRCLWKILQNTRVWTHIFMKQPRNNFSRSPLNDKIHTSFSVFTGYQK